MPYIWQLRNYPLIWQITFETISPETTLNAKVNNWGVELSDCNIKFKFIKEVKTPLLIPCLG